MNRASERKPSLLMRRLIVLFLAAAALRVAWVGVRYGRDGAGARLEYPDEEAYVLSARSLAAGNGLIDEFGFRATYMPAYPAFLSLLAPGADGLLLARLAQAILAAWVAPGTFLLATAFLRLTSARRCAVPLAVPAQPSPPASGFDTRGSVSGYEVAVPLIAGVLAAVDPFLVFFSGLLLTEALFAAVWVTAWALVLRLADRKQPAGWPVVIATGAALLASVMLRPGAMVLVVTAAGLLVLLRRFDGKGWIHAIALLIIVIAGLIPWAARNQRVIGEWRWLTTRGGISLYDGVRPGALGESDLAHTKLIPEIIGLSETQWDRFFHDRARREIHGNPSRLIHLAGHKFLRTWSLLPNVPEYRYGRSGLVSGAWMTLLLAGAVAGLWRYRHRAGLCLMLLWPVLLTTAMHMLFVASVRYRVSVMPCLMVLSAAGLASLATWCGGVRARAGSHRGDTC